jgi:hypothetical protein
MSAIDMDIRFEHRDVSGSMIESIAQKKVNGNIS